MVICKVCSAKNEDSEEFCQVCGKYLPWHGDRILTVAPEQPQEEEKEAEDSSETHLTFWQKVLIFFHLSEHHSSSQSSISVAKDADAGTDSGQTVSSSEQSGPNRHKNQFSGYMRNKASNVLTENFDVYMVSQAVKERRQKAKSAAAIDSPDDKNSTSPADEKSELSDVGITTVATEDTDNEAKDLTLNGSAAENTSLALIPTSADITVVNQTDTVEIGKESFIASRKPGDTVEVTKPVLPIAPVASAGVASSTVRSRSTALRKPDEALTASKSKKILAPGPEEKDDTPQPGDIYCARCNQFNSPQRVFCRRCGYELNSPVGENAAISYQPLSWWQRHWHSDVRLVGAGQRPGRWGKIVSGAGSQGRAWRITGRVLAGALALVLLFSLIGPFAPSMQNWFRNLYHNAENSVNVTYTQVFAMGANASSSNPSHPPAYAVDDADNTWWQSANYPPKSKYPGVGARLTILFAQSETINKIGWLGGVAGTPQAYLSEARPREIRLTFYPSKYHVIEHLKDTQSFQQFSVNPVNTTSIVCTILKVYPSATGHAVAITEIEFFQRV